MAKCGSLCQLGSGKGEDFSQGLGLRSAEGRVPGRMRSPGEDPYTVETATSDAASAVSPRGPREELASSGAPDFCLWGPREMRAWFQVCLPRLGENEPLRDHPLLLWPTCPPARPSQTFLTLFMLPALRSHTGGPSCRHLEAPSWLRASPALLCLPGGRRDTPVLGKLSVPAGGCGVGGPRALEPARQEGERTLSSLLAEGHKHGN